MTPEPDSKLVQAARIPLRPLEDHQLVDFIRQVFKLDVISVRRDVHRHFFNGRLGAYEYAESVIVVEYQHIHLNQASLRTGVIPAYLFQRLQGANGRRLRRGRENFLLYYQASSLFETATRYIYQN